MRISEFRQGDLVAAAACRLFADCDEEEIRCFLRDAGCCVLSFAGGERIPAEMREGRWGIVLQGSVRIYSGTDGGGTLLINVVGSGQPFDIASLAGCECAGVISDARAVGKCRIILVNASDVMKLMAEHPKIAANCMAFLCGRIGFLNRKLHTLSRTTSEQKLADFLLGEFETDDSGAFVRVKSCVELAVRLNLSRASLYRALGILEDSGCIARRGKRIDLLDLAALQSV